MFTGAIAFPKGRFRTTNLTSAAQAVLTTNMHVSGFRIFGGAGAQVVIFRAIADVPVYFQVPIPAGGYVESNQGWFAEAGLEVLTAGAAGDVEVVVHYVKA